MEELNVGVASILVLMIVTSVLFIMILAVISSNVRKHNRLLKQQKEILENIVMIQNTVLIELQKQNTTYTQINQPQYQQPGQEQMNQQYMNPYMNNRNY